MDSVKIKLFCIGCHVVQGKFDNVMWQQLIDADSKCN